MKRKSKGAHARVRRITIDERLDEGLLKIAVADLLSNHEDLSEDPLDAWTDETVRLVSRDDLLPMFELTGDEAWLKTLVGDPSSDFEDEKLVGAFWRSLEEGQVFLVGEIEVKGGDASAAMNILAKPGPRTVLRIDRIERIKKKHEALYSKALTGGR